LARAFQSKRVTDCDAVLCSSSGWAHGISTDAPKIVYSHNPARWLYQAEDYFRGQPAVAKWVLSLLRSRLVDWDKKNAAAADTYLVNSSAVAGRVLQTYGRHAEVLHPPVSIKPEAERKSVDGVTPGFFLCIARSRGYKHVDIVAEAAVLAGVRLVVVGTADGPCSEFGVSYLGSVTDAELRWLYENAAYLVGAAHEDFGLTPIEANSFGTPALVLRSGGYLETVRDGVNGLFFDALSVECVSEAMKKASAIQLDRSAVLAVADEFSEGRFGSALRERVMALMR
jgi:glycosyltransferase involved in cell wall biosynthesis